MNKAYVKSSVRFNKDGTYEIDKLPDITKTGVFERRIIKMSNLHNDLDSWASKSRLKGNSTIEIDNDTAHFIAKELRRLQFWEDRIDAANKFYERFGNSIDNAE